MKNKKIYEWYYIEKELLEKRKNKRVITAILTPGILLFIYMVLKTKKVSLDNILLIFISCIAIGIVDFILHSFLFSLTLSKNLEESIELENKLKEKIKEKEM